MTEEKMRVIDRDFEARMSAKAAELKKEAAKDVEIAERYVESGKHNFEHMVKEHPYAFVMGAFIGGLLVGSILSKRD